VASRPGAEQFPALVRECVNQLKSLHGVELYGDRREALERAIGEMLRVFFVDRDRLLRSIVKARRRRRSAQGSLSTIWPDVAREIAGLHGTEQAPVSVPPAESQLDGELPPIVQLCVFLLRSGDFAEISASDEELGAAFWTALSDYVPSPEEMAATRKSAARAIERFRMADPEVQRRMLQELLPGWDHWSGASLIQRILDWFRRGGGGPRDGPGGGTGSPPAVPV